MRFANGIALENALSNSHEPSRVAARAGKGSLVVLDHLGQVHGLEVHHPSYAQRVVVIVVVVVLISFGLVTSEKIDD